jgi:hypothetical protein
MGWDCLPAIAIGAGAARLRRDERGVQAGAGHRHEPLRSHLLPQPRRRRLPVSLGLHHREVDFHSSVFTVRFCANMRVRLHISHERFFCFFFGSSVRKQFANDRVKYLLLNLYNSVRYLAGIDCFSLWRCSSNRLSFHQYVTWKRVMPNLPRSPLQLL